MNEKQIEERFQAYSKDEKKLREIKIERKTKRWANIISVFLLIVGISIQVVVHALGVYFYQLSEASYEKEVALVIERGEDAKLVDNFSSMTMLWHIFVGAGSLTLLAIFFTWYFHNDYCETGRDKIKKHLRNSFTNEEEEKRLIAETGKREEFFRLYELLKDPDYRDAYFTSMKPSLEDFEKALGKKRK